MKNLLGCFLLLSLLFTNAATARLGGPPKTVTGVVTDASSGAPLQGATVSVKNTATVTSSDADGKFSITVPSDDAVVDISFVGYVTLSLPVKGTNSLSVKLNKDINSLDEVVVVGYGTQKKGDLTSAVDSVKQ